jgi:hypothetical protein
MVQTAQTQTPDAIPEHAHVGEFLNDADKLGFYQRQVDGLAADDPERPELIRALKAARRAASATALEIAEATELAEAALAAESTE